MLTKYRVSLTDTNGEYRSTYDIMKDIASVWGDMTSMEQAALIEQLAGTRQQDIFASIINNFREASGAMDAMNNSAGALKDAYSVYTDSTTGHLKSLTAAWQEFSQSAIPQDTIRDIIDLGSKLIEMASMLSRTIDFFGGINTVIAAASSVVAIKGISSAINTAREQADLLGSTTSIVFGDMAKSASASATSIGVIIGLFTSLMGYIKDAMREDAKEIENATKLANKANESVISLSEIARQYKEAYGKSDIKKIQVLQSDINTLLGDQASAVDLVNGKYEEQLEIIKGIQIEAAKKSIGDIRSAYLDSEKALRGKGIAGGNIASFAADSMRELIPNKDDWIDLSSDSWFVDYYNALIDELDTTDSKSTAYLDSLRQQIDLLEEHVKLAENSAEEFLNVLASDFYYNNIQEGFDGSEQSINEANAAFLEFIKSSDLSSAFDLKILDEEDVYSALNKFMSFDIPEELYDISSASDGTKSSFHEISVATEELAGRFDNLKKAYDVAAKAEEDMASGGGLSYDTIKALSEASEDYTDYLYEENGVIKLNTEAFLEMSAAQSTSDISDLQSQIDRLDQSREALKDAYDSGAMSYDQYAYSLAQVDEQAGALSKTMSILKSSAESITNEYDESAISLDSLGESYSIATEAQKEMDETGTVSYDTLNRLSGVSENYRDYLYEQDGAIRLNTAAFLEMADAQARLEASKLQEKIDDLTHSKQKLREEFERGKITDEEYYKRLADIDPQIESLSIDVGVLESSINSLHADMASALSNPLDLSGFLNGLDSAYGKIESLVSAMGDLANGTALTKGKMLELAAQFPEMLLQADLFTDGSIEGQQKILDAVLQSYETQYDASIEEKIAELEADKEAVQAQIDLEAQKSELIQKIALLTGNAQLADQQQVTDLMSEYLNLQGSNFVTYSNGILSVNKQQLEGQTQQTADFAVKSEEYIWNPYSNIIAAAQAEGLEGGLSALQNYSVQMGNGLNNVVNNVLGPYATAYANAMKGVQPSAASDASGAGINVNLDYEKTNKYRNEAAIIEEWGQEAVVSAYEIIEQVIDEWAAAEQEAVDLRLEDLILMLDNLDIEIDNLEKLKDLDFEDLFEKLDKGDDGGSGGGGGDGGSGDSEETEEDENYFKKMYEWHNHLVEMNQETDADYLLWLDEAYKQAYEDGEITLDEYYSYEEEVYKGLVDIQERAQDAIEKLIDYRVKMLEDEAKKQKETLEDELDDLKDFYDKQKDLLKENKEEEEYEEEQEEKRKAVADIQAELDMLANDDSAKAKKRKLELQEELIEAQKDLDKFEKDRAYDLAEKALDDAFEEEEARIQAEIDKIDDLLNDPDALYNQALEDISKNGEALYEEMVEYAKQNGEDISEVEEIWENAYKYLSDYDSTKELADNLGIDEINDTLKEFLEKLDLYNATDYETDEPSTDEPKKPEKKEDKPPKKPKPPKKKDDDDGGGKGDDDHSGDGSAAVGDKVKVTGSAYSSVKGGGPSVDVSGKTMYIKSIWDNAANPYWQGDYIYEVAYSKNGAAIGWVKLSQLSGYAKGTSHAKAGLHRVNEKGAEAVFTSSNGNDYRLLNDGDKVLNAKATDFLYKFANSDGKLLADIIAAVTSSGVFDKISGNGMNNSIKMGDIYIYGNADEKTVSQIRREQRSQVDYMLKSFKSLNK